MSALDPSSPTFEKDFEEVSGAMEKIKNANKGYAPGTEPPEPKPAKPAKSPDASEQPSTQPPAKEAADITAKQQGSLPGTQPKANLGVWPRDQWD